MQAVGAGPSRAGDRGDRNGKEQEEHLYFAACLLACCVAWVVLEDVSFPFTRAARNGTRWLTPYGLKIENCLGSAMSLVLRPLSQLLLRTAAPRAPTCSQAAAKLVSNHSSWCRRRQSAVRRLSVTSRGRCLLQEHVSGEEGSLSEDELHLSDSCVMVTDSHYS